MTTGRMIGLVGGLGVGATNHYYREIVAAHQARNVTPRLLITHADVQRVFTLVAQGDRDGLARYLALIIKSVAAGGAAFAAIGAVTPHLCMPELIACSPVPVVDLVAETARAIAARKLSRVAVWGTHVTVETAVFGRLGAVEVVPPRPDEIAVVYDCYLELVARGTGSAAIRDRLRAIAHAVVARERVDAIVFAGTELALVFDRDNTDFPHLDCGQIHVEAMVARALEP